MSFTVEMRAKSGEVPELDVMDSIGKARDGTGVTVEKVSGFLREHKKSPEIRVNISSTGGDAFSGFAIYSALLDFPGKVVTRGIGVVASAAALIYLAGSVRELAANAMFMLHGVRWSGLSGTADELRKYAETSDRHNENFGTILRTRTKIPGAQVVEYLKGEKWFDAREALEAGICTRVLGEAPRMAASLDRGRLEGFQSTPDAAFEIADGPKCLADLVRLPKSRGVTPEMVELASMNAERAEILARRDS